MKKLTKNLGTATKILLVALLMAGVSADSFGQKKKKDKKKKNKKEKKLERPAKVGNAGVDTYVTSAFDLYEKNQKISEKLASAGENAGDMKTIKSDLEAQLKEVAGLLAKSKDAIDGANKLPMKEKPKAVKAVKTGTSALNATKDAIPGQLELIKTQGGK